MRKSCEHYVTADNYVSAVPFLQKYYNNKMYNRYQVRAFFQHHKLPEEWAKQNAHRQLYCEIYYVHTFGKQRMVFQINIIDADDGEVVEYWEYYIPNNYRYYSSTDVCIFNEK